jgi:hypothetical protein
MGTDRSAGLPDFVEPAPPISVSRVTLSLCCEFGIVVAARKPFITCPRHGNVFTGDAIVSFNIRERHDG